MPYPPLRQALLGLYVARIGQLADAPGWQRRASPSSLPWHEESPARLADRPPAAFVYVAIAVDNGALEWAATFPESRESTHRAHPLLDRDLAMNCSVCNHPNPEGARFCSGCGALLANAEAAGSGLVGQVLGGRYAVRRVIGEGGMGVVYEAEQRMGEGTRLVAIKTLLPELSNDHTLVSRFHRESGTVAQLEHPNTIRFYDYGETPDGVLYIVMELVTGRRSPT